MTATHPQPKRRNRTRRRRALPDLHWGWYTTAVVAVIAAAQTWPAQIALITALIAAYLILRSVRPARLARIFDSVDTATDAIADRRRALPATGRTLAAFQQMSPARFERAIAELALEHPDVHTATAVGQANDRGMDVLVHLTDGRRILIQCKRYTGNVGSETVQTINGVYRDIHGCHQAVIVTTAGFTRAARETNTMLPRPIRLVDGTQLTAWANGAPAPW